MLLVPNRRRLLQGFGAAALAAPAVVRAQAIFAEYPYSLGVASGEPAPDGFVIWTRLAPQPLEPHGGMPMQSLSVRWEVAEDDRFAKIVQQGDVIARPELAHAVHVEVAGLQPNRPYWYRFVVGKERSPVGRGRTTPAAGAPVQRLRFAAAGCQHFEAGLYTAFGHLAKEPDLDFVYHYGDYIYEGRSTATWRNNDGTVSANPRKHVGDETYSLDDYRRRYAQYKMDLDLQAAHAAAPWFVSADDHEIDNNWAADIEQDGTPPEIFRSRMAAAFQAFYEHMPLRRASLPAAASMRLNRRATWGDLMQIHLLDTRQYRSDQPCGDGFKPACPGVTAEAATMLGAEQERWLGEGLAARGRWNLLAQQVMLLRMDRRTGDDLPQPLLNLDSWAGYVAPQQRLLRQIAGRNLKNVVVLTGDEHQNFANEITAEGAGWSQGPAVATEFVATSISSGGDGQDQRRGTDRLLSGNPRCKFINDQRGYLINEVTPQAWRADFRVMDQIRQPGGRISTRASFAVENGRPGVQPA
jgi:alkaline phosphatase D